MANQNRSHGDQSDDKVASTRSETSDATGGTSANAARTETSGKSNGTARSNNGSGTSTQNAEAGRNKG